MISPEYDSNLTRAAPTGESSDAGSGCRRFVSIEELSEATTLSISTLRRLFKRGLLVGYQPGGPRSRIIFPIDAIEKAPKAATVESKSVPGESSPPSANSKRGPRPKWMDMS
jgi:hypothetical protein